MNLIVLDSPIHLPVTIDLILVPALFILLYTLVSILYPTGHHLPLPKTFGHRLLSAFSATVILLVCVSIAGLISYVLDDHLPRDMRKGLDTLGMSADLYLQGYKPAHLQGNIIALLGLVAGIVMAVIRLSKQPPTKRTIPLTPQQRMTPYQRMLLEQGQRQPNRPAPAKSRPAPIDTPPPPVKRRPTPVDNPPTPAKSRPTPVTTPPTPATTRSAPITARPAPVITRPTATISQRPLCYNKPLPTFEPEAVNYRPL